MCRVVALDRQRSELLGRIQQLLLVQGVVLEHGRGVEDLPGSDAHQALDLGKTEVLVIQQPRLLAL